MNKLYDYMMSGVPIVSAVEARNDPVSEAGCGISVKVENPQATAEGILKIYNMTSKQWREMGERGKQYVFTKSHISYFGCQILASNGVGMMLKS